MSGVSIISLVGVLIFISSCRCCDLFVAAHLGNPCGHSFCGECGRRWIIINKNKGCPVCRTQLNRTTPMIPVIALDSVVETHILSMRCTGDEDWAEGGRKFTEFASRKENWKRDSTKRAKPPPPPPRPRVTEIIDLEMIDSLSSWMVPDDEDDESYGEEDEDLSLVPAESHRSRHRTRRTTGRRSRRSR